MDENKLKGMGNQGQDFPGTELKRAERLRARAEAEAKLKPPKPKKVRKFFDNL